MLKRQSMQIWRPTNFRILSKNCFILQIDAKLELQKIRFSLVANKLYGQHYLLLHSLEKENQ